MKMDVARIGSVSVLSPRGPIAQADAQEFGQQVQDLRVKTNGRMVLEFSQVAYMDSEGIEVLWDLADMQREGGKTIKMAAVPQLCRETFELTGIAGQIDLFDSAESAVRSFL